MYDIKNLLSRRFLVWSYLYYQLDESLVSDNEYDKLCVELKNEIKKNSGARDYYYSREIIEKHFLRIFYFIPMYTQKLFKGNIFSILTLIQKM